KRFAARLQEQEIKLNVTTQAQEFLAKSGYDPAFGARPLKRFISKEIETPVSRMLIAGEILPGNTLNVDSDGKKLEFKIKH
ncbi:MAG: hypothetical protein RRY34_10510, partial [Victivallaceae bacterium]